MPTARAEETLDPDDWQALARLGHRMVDDVIEHMRTARERPAWKPIPNSVKDQLQAPLPVEPESAEEIYDEYRDLVQPFQK